MGDPADNHLFVTVSDSVDDTIVADTNTPAIVAALKFLGSGLVWLFQRDERLFKPRANLGWQFAQVTGGRGHQKDFIVHVRSSARVRQDAYQR